MIRYQECRTVQIASVVNNMTIMRLGDVTIRIHILLIILVGTFVVCGQTIEVLIVLASVLFHEGCHLLVARVWGYSIKTVELLPFGGVAKIEGLCGWGVQELTIVLAGPIGSGIVATVLYAIAKGQPGMMPVIAEVNMMLALWNLLPAYPLDGGRILHHFFHSYMKPNQAVRRTVRISQVVAIGILFFALYRLTVADEVLISMLLMAVMIWKFAREEVSRYGLMPFAIMARRSRELKKNRAIKMQWYTVLADMQVSEVISLFRPEVYTMVRVVKGDGTCCDLLSETIIWQKIDRYYLTDRIEKFCTEKE